MTDKEKLQSIENLLDSGVIGINSGEFVFNQSAILSAMAKTDRELLIRILAKVEKRDVSQLLQESINRDVENLTELLSSTPKVVT